MLAALLLALLAAPAPVNGWPAASAPNRRILPFDLSRIDELKVLRPGRKATLYAIGNGPNDYRRDRLPVILVHGIKGHPRELQTLANRLRRDDRQIHVLAYDGWNKRTSATGADFAEELITLQKWFGPRANREVVIVAHSMGGIVSRWALVKLQHTGLRWLEGFKRVRLFALDSPWHGYNGPADGFFMNVSRVFLPDALEDMRAASNFFVGDPKAKDGAAKAGVIRGTLPENVEVQVVFAQKGDEVWDYTEKELSPLVPKLTKYFTDETPIRDNPKIVNYWNGLIQAKAYWGFQEELRRLGEARKLTDDAVRAALLKHYPRFPGDHVGVLNEHPGQLSAVDWLCERLR